MFKRDFRQVDRAICDPVAKGFTKVLTKKGSAEILGATFVGGPAGDMINMIVVGMKNKKNLKNYLKITIMKIQMKIIQILKVI